jgi:hypothetical protein
MPDKPNSHETPRPARLAHAPRLLCLTLFALGAPAGCGDYDPAADGNSTGGNAGTSGTGNQGDRPLLPLKSGNSWTFRVTDGPSVTTKVTTVGDLEPVGGSGPNSAVMAFKLTTTKGDGMDETVSWQAVVGSKVVRYREQAFHAGSGALELEEHWDPFKLRVDGAAERVAQGASWLDEYL